MKHENVIITAVGCVVTLVVSAGIVLVARSVVMNTDTVYAASVADNCYTYTSKYEDLANLYCMQANANATPKSVTVVETKTQPNVAVTVTQDGTVIANEEPANPNVRVDVNVDNGQTSVSVSVPGKPDEEPEEQKEKPVIIDGEEIYISEIATFCEDGTLVYRIRWGDTLCRISRIFGYSVQELAEYNHIKNPNLIYADSSLRIPSADKIPYAN